MSNQKVVGDGRRLRLYSNKCWRGLIDNVVVCSHYKKKKNQNRMKRGALELWVGRVHRHSRVVAPCPRAGCGVTCRNVRVLAYWPVSLPVSLSLLWVTGVEWSVNADKKLDTPYYRTGLMSCRNRSVISVYLQGNWATATARWSYIYIALQCQVTYNQPVVL